MAGYWASSSSNSALVTTSASTGIMLENRSLQLEGKQCGCKTEKVRTREPTATPASMSAAAMRNESVCTDIRTPYTGAAAVAERVWASNQQCVCRAVRAGQGPGTEVVRRYVLRRVQLMRLTGWCWRAWGIRKYKRAQRALLLRLSPVAAGPDGTLATVRSSKAIEYRNFNPGTNTGYLYVQRSHPGMRVPRSQGLSGNGRSAASRTRSKFCQRQAVRHQHPSTWHRQCLPTSVNFQPPPWVGRYLLGIT